MLFTKDLILSSEPFICSPGGCRLLLHDTEDEDLCTDSGLLIEAEDSEAFDDEMDLIFAISLSCGKDMANFDLNLGVH